MADLPGFISEGGQMKPEPPASLDACGAVRDISGRHVGVEEACILTKSVSPSLHVRASIPYLRIPHGQMLVLDCTALLRSSRSLRSERKVQAGGRVFCVR